MQLTVLVDNNTTLNKQYLGEPGLSFYLEDGSEKISSTADTQISSGEMPDRWESIFPA